MKNLLETLKNKNVVLPVAATLLTVAVIVVLRNKKALVEAGADLVD